MTISVNGLHLHTSSVQKLEATDILITNAYAIMSDPISYMPWMAKKDDNMNKIKDLIWEWDEGTISPYDLVKKLKEITNYE